jgi:hypothetical protein
MWPASSSKDASPRRPAPRIACQLSLMRRSSVRNWRIAERASSS